MRIKTLQVLIADPDITCRDLIVKALETISDVSVLGTCPNGKSCIDKIIKTGAEIVIAAPELGDMNIVKFLEEVKANSPKTGVIVVPRPDDPGQAELAVQALGAGAFDYIVKPMARCTEEQIPVLNRLLAPKLLCFAIQRFSEIAKATRNGTVPIREKPETVAQKPVSPNSMPAPLSCPYRVVVIGVSTGGPEALARMMPLFPANFPVPIVIVLHMPKLFTGAMARDLDKKSLLSIHEAQDNDILQPGHAYLAPGGIHLIIESGTRGNLALRTVDGIAENGCKPAVDVLFRSAAETVREKAIGVILTGMGTDGTLGAKMLRQFNAPIIAQDEATSVVWGMPGNVVTSGIATEELSLTKIPERIIAMMCGNG